MLHIPKPCHEDWNAMTPTQKGAFCGSCQKEVIDFTAMTDVQVLNYLSENTGKKLCGRATASQVNRLDIVIDENIIFAKISTWKKYLAIVLICFGSTLLSCTEFSTKGKIMTGETVVIPEKIDSSNFVGDESSIEIVKRPLPNITGVLLVNYKPEIIDTPSSIMGFLAPKLIMENLNQDTIDCSLPIDSLRPIADDFMMGKFFFPIVIKPKSDSGQIKKDTLIKQIDSCTSMTYT